MSKRIVSPLSNVRITLRPLEESDLELTLQWRNDNRRNFFTSSSVSAEQHAAWFQKYQQRDDDFVFVIVDNQTKNSVGQVSLYNIDWEKKTAEFGRLIIASPYRATGLAHSATRLLTHAAVAQWGITQIYLSSFAWNQRAIRIYSDCGFHTIRASEGVIEMEYRE